MFTASGEGSHHFIRGQTQQRFIYIDADGTGPQKVIRFGLSVMYTLEHTDPNVNLSWTKAFNNYSNGQVDEKELMRPRMY